MKNSGCASIMFGALATLALLVLMWVGLDKFLVGYLLDPAWFPYPWITTAISVALGVGLVVGLARADADGALDGVHVGAAERAAAADEAKLAHGCQLVGQGFALLALEGDGGVARLHRDVN